MVSVRIPVRDHARQVHGSGPRGAGNRQLQLHCFRRVEERGERAGVARSGGGGAVSAGMGEAVGGVGAGGTSVLTSPASVSSFSNLGMNFGYVSMRNFFPELWLAL